MSQNRLAPESLIHFFRDIKIAHSIFALPFAIVGVLIGQLALPSGKQILLSLVCMVTARTFAMGMNRFLDRDLDAENSRTAGRSIPSGRLSAKACLTWSLVAGVLFVAAAAGLSALAGWLAVPLLAVLASYSFMKRISWLTHWYLGACLGLAPIAVNIALSGEVKPSVLLVGIAVMFWTAGFDILYSLQDREFDIIHKFHSVPAAFGIKGSLILSRISFVCMIVCLLIAGIHIAAGTTYFVGIAIVSGILIFEQIHVSKIDFKSDSKRIGTAFFTANAWVSVLFYLFVQMDYLIK